MIKKLTKNILLALIVIMVMLVSGSSAVASEFNRSRTNHHTSAENPSNAKNVNNSTSSEPNNSLPIGQSQSVAKIYKLKSVSIFIMSDELDYWQIENLYINYIRFQFVAESEVGTDCIARESLKPMKITDFGKIIDIDYNNTNVDVNNTNIKLSFTFTGGQKDYSFENKIVKMLFHEGEDLSFSGTIILDEDTKLRLEIKGDIETLNN